MSAIQCFLLSWLQSVLQTNLWYIPLQKCFLFLSHTNFEFKTFVIKLSTILIMGTWINSSFHFFPMLRYIYRILLNPPITNPLTTDQPTNDHLPTNWPTDRPTDRSQTDRPTYAVIIFKRLEKSKIFTFQNTNTAGKMKSVIRFII